MNKKSLNEEVIENIIHTLPEMQHRKKTSLLKQSKIRSSTEIETKRTFLS